jgi:sterol desaturase/sphingolipid hydroxylase (fatty acid hydroxylase superfamily)
VFYALLVIPLIVLLGTGFSGLLAHAAPYLVLPRVPGAPGWCFVALAVIGIDAVDWLTHLANHRLTALWRLHAVHHSQEELSILTAYRAHLLVVLAAAALMAGTMVGFILARSVGIFGFHLTFSSGLAWTVLIVEGAGVILLLLTAALLRRQL